MEHQPSREATLDYPRFLPYFLSTTIASRDNTLRASLPRPEELDDLLQIICKGDTQHGAEDGIRTRALSLARRWGRCACFESTLSERRTVAVW